ncbi:MAG: dihydroorotate dehydrogenase (quinone), partial [Xanthomarina gelatinilytica]|nr:dihydroorotate dehydrogenase (quinone) [Xanthomarina gelatinilytica]
GLTSDKKDETGGLSGKPLTNRSTEVIRFLAEKSNKAFPIIGVGGIHTATDALEKLDAGADLIQLYTGFIYEGPKLVKTINKALLQ